MRFNKKGAGSISEHMVLWIPKFVYLVIAFLSVLFLLRLLVISNIETSEAESRLLIGRIMYSPNLISYLDTDIKRSYPSLIDFDKFRKLENVDLNSMDTNTITYGEDNNVVAAKLTLKNIDLGNEDIIYYNKDK